MGAFDIYYNRSGILDSFNSFLGGLGAQRQQASAQQGGPAAAAAAAAQQQQAYGYAYAAQGDAAKRQRTG